ncbi:transmembrane protein, putative (macronuclear) [Tetrahymena thermophila SB210]|uniref:Transmembrane protein, putative n=1 Tax=Tetrahymena thermophila (strain SB210) TaxID=312017 RepID=W7X282_TETTS|nr:transmembrane protein, putative [Tetrahymena thermophila SB210]EWS73295.1 transmembrane protein, putative [Tetrahymena thermophila SB210]|eukprot:XP_012654204.1 transmembrane protein, putative [Tetrahymena thermophila SB210]
MILLIQVFEITSIAEKIIGLFGLVILGVRSALKYYSNRKINKIMKESSKMTCELIQNMDNNAISTFLETQNSQFKNFKLK